MSTAEKQKIFLSKQGDLSLSEAEGSAALIEQRRQQDVGVQGDNHVC